MDPATQSALFVFLILVLFLMAIVVIVVVLSKSTKPLRSDASDIPAHNCPNCGRPMQTGFALAGKGVAWREASQKYTLWQMTIFGSLPNTVNKGFTRRENRAWRCETCQLILMDHSEMVG